MDDQDLKQHLQQFPAGDHRAGPECPDDQVLIAALDGEYRVLDQPAFEAHVSSCDHCIARMGLIGRLQRGATDAEIPDLAMARALRLFHSRPAIRRIPAWAAAAMIGFAAVLTTLWFAQWPESPDSAVLPVPEVRNLDPDAYRPQIMAPTEGSSVHLRDQLFEWTAVPGILHYSVRIVSADGTLIWQERVQNHVWRLPEHLRLPEGENYYFRVDAYLTQAKSLSSRHVMFRISPDE